MFGVKRLFLTAPLALAFAARAWAGTVSVVPEAALAPLGVPAIILGGPAALPPTLSAALQAQSLTVTSLPPALVAPYLIERAVAVQPVERAAAKIIAASLVKNPGAAGGSDPGVQELAHSAKQDPALAGWFDGASAGNQSLELDGLTLKRGTWRRGGAKLERLGQGEFGFVDVHPSIAGAVMKTVEHSAEIVMMSNPRPETTAAAEKETADLLSSIDAGPRHFGGRVVKGRLVSVRERVYGDTLDELFSGRQFGLPEQELVLDLLRRMSASGVMTNDLRPANIMIGRTLLDPRRRAYVVDGGSKAAFPGGLDPEDRLSRILHVQIVLHGRFDQHVGWVEHTKSLAQMMAGGLDRSARVTRWQKFRGFLKDFAAAAVP